MRSTLAPHALSLAWFAVASPPARAETAWPDLVLPSAPVEIRTQDAAVIAAIEDYDHLLDIPGAIDAGRAWRDWLIGGLGVPAGSVVLLSQEEVTSESLATAVTEAVTRVGAGGRLWFVFVGQASPTCDGRDVLLFAADAGPEAAGYYSGSLPLSAVQSLLTLGGPDHALLVLDASINERDRSVDKLSCLTMPVMPPIALAPQDAEILITAGQPEEFAGTLLGADRPALSWALLYAARGWGDQDGDGQVTVAEALTYARHLMRATERRLPQTPELWGAGGDLVLARAAEPRADLAEILSDVAQHLTRERAARLDEASASLALEARRAWEAAATSGPEAARAFLDRYRLATVRAEGQRRFPSIPEIALARAAAGPDAAVPVPVPTSEAVATRDQLRGEMEHLARRNAWKGVEQAFRDLEALAAAGVEPSPEDLDLGAQAARAMGDVESVRARLERIALLQPTPEALAWLDDLERTYGQVDLRDRTGGLATLSAARPPLAPDQRAVIESAASILGTVGRYRGGLPAGVYHLGTATFVVVPGDPVLEVSARKER